MSAAAPPSQDEVSISVKANIKNKNCELKVKLDKPGWIIRSVIMFSDSLFKGGSFAVHPAESSNAILVPLSSVKNAVEAKVDLKILIGAGINAPFFVCHQVSGFQLPQFAFFAPLDSAEL